MQRIKMKIFSYLLSFNAVLSYFVCVIFNKLFMIYHKFLKVLKKYIIDIIDNKF